MKMLAIYLAVLIGSLTITGYTRKNISPESFWCWSRGQGRVVTSVTHPVGTEYVSYGSYGTELDWNDQHLIPLNYDQTQGKIIYYQQCVWCHSDSTPAGPSNRSNVTPTPPLMNDGATLNAESDAHLMQIIAQGGSAVGKSAMMPPYGRMLTQAEISDLVAYTRVIASPSYVRPTGWKYRLRFAGHKQ